MSTGNAPQQGEPVSAFALPGVPIDLIAGIEQAAQPVGVEHCRGRGQLRDPLGFVADRVPVGSQSKIPVGALMTGIVRTLGANSSLFMKCFTSLSPLPVR